MDYLVHACVQRTEGWPLATIRQRVQNMGLDLRKSVSGISDNARHTPACSVTETSYNIEHLHEAILDIILCRKQITKALIKLHGCTGWSVPLLYACNNNMISIMPLRVSKYLETNMESVLKFWRYESCYLSLEFDSKHKCQNSEWLSNFFYFFFKRYSKKWAKLTYPQR